MTSNLYNNNLSDSFFLVNKNRVHPIQMKMISALFVNYFTSGILSFCTFKYDVNVIFLLFISDDIEATELNNLYCVHICAREHWL